MSTQPAMSSPVVGLLTTPTTAEVDFIISRLENCLYIDAVSTKGRPARITPRTRTNWRAICTDELAKAKISPSDEKASEALTRLTSFIRELLLMWVTVGELHQIIGVAMREEPESASDADLDRLAHSFAQKVLKGVL